MLKHTVWCGLALSMESVFLLCCSKAPSTVKCAWRFLKKYFCLQLEPLLPGSNTCSNRMAGPAMLRGHVWISWSRNSGKQFCRETQSIIGHQVLLTCRPWTFYFVVRRWCKKQSKTVTELKSAIEEFASNLGEDAIRKIARHVRKRALACVATQGRHFEHIL